MVVNKLHESVDSGNDLVEHRPTLETGRPAAPKGKGSDPFSGPVALSRPVRGPDDYPVLVSLHSAAPPIHALPKQLRGYVGYPLGGQRYFGPFRLSRRPDGVQPTEHSSRSERSFLSQ